MSDDLGPWYVRADRIEQLERERDEWKSRYEHHNHERLETLNLNAMQASKIGSLMNKIATLEKEIKDLRGKE
jgi:lipase chaperone LimK